MMDIRKWLKQPALIASSNTASTAGNNSSDHGDITLPAATVVDSSSRPIRRLCLPRPRRRSSRSRLRCPKHRSATPRRPASARGPRQNRACPGILVILLAIDRIGRKKSLALCFFMFSLCMLPLFACIGRLSVTICICIARAFISGGFQVAFVYTPEVYPTETRAIAMGTSSAISRVGALITPFVAQVMLRQSVSATLSFYLIVCLLGGVASLLLPIETLDRGLQESCLDQEAGQQTATTNQTNNTTHSSNQR